MEMAVFLLALIACLQLQCAFGFHFGGSNEKDITCVGNALWRQEYSCHWCECRDGRVHCTNKNCAAVHQGRICVSGSHYLDAQGRSCVCGEMGYPVCDGHLQSSSEHQLQGARCSTGSHFKNYYTTWCRCDEGVVSCRNYTHAVPAHPPEPDADLMLSKNVLLEETGLLTLASMMNVSDLCRFNLVWLAGGGEWCGCRGGKPVCSNRNGSPATALPDGGVVPGGRCVPGSVFRNKDGQQSECSKEGFQVNVVGVKLSNFIVEGQRCADGTYFMNDSCNWCHCVDGRIKCNNYHPTTTTTTTTSSRHANSCQKLLPWKKDQCNWCGCINGQARCTVAGCRERLIQCTPGSSWYNRCGHFCTCTLRGQRRCSENADCEDEELDFLVKEGTPCSGDAYVRRDSCNWCVCFPGMQIWACASQDCNTTMRAVLPRVNKLNKDFGFNKAERQPSTSTREACDINGVVWAHHDTCNWCGCRNGSFVCSTMDCRKDSRPVDCIPGSSLQDPCGRKCTCPADGVRMCPETPCQTHELALSTCKGDSYFVLDNHWCRCVDGEIRCSIFENWNRRAQVNKLM